MLGSSTRLHSIYGAATKLKGVRCFFCRKWVYLKTGHSISENIVYSQVYCDSCALQARNGSIKAGETSHVSQWYKNKCQKCGRPIGRVYKFCYNCDPNRLFRPPKEKRPPEPKPKQDTTYGADRNLRKDLGFCQNIDCENRRVPFEREKMWKVKRRFSQLDKWGGMALYFCSKDCALKFIHEQGDYMQYFLYRVWGKFTPITA